MHDAAGGRIRPLTPGEAVLIPIPFLYEVPGDDVGPCWAAEILPHEPVELEGPEAGRKVVMPFFAIRGTEGRVADDGLWLPLDVRPLQELVEAREFAATVVMHMTVGMPLPVAGMTPAFSATTARIQIVEPGRHAGLPSREAAFAGALEIASRTAVRRGIPMTSSWEPMVPMTRPPSGESGVVMRDVHGLWRHPVLRLRSFRSVETPLVALVAAQAIPKYPFSPAARKLGVADLDLSGFKSGLPEADMAVYDVLREIAHYLPVGTWYGRHRDPDILAVAARAEDLLDLYEDHSTPLPSASETADAIDGLACVFEAFSEGPQRTAFDAAIARFRRWRAVRGHLLELGPDVRDANGFEEDEAIASFRM